MRYIFLIFLSLFIGLIACFKSNKQSQIYLYFEKNKWQYPFHYKEDSELRFRNTFYDDSPIIYDTSSLSRFDKSFLNQALVYFKNKLPTDTSVGYVLGKPIIYNSSTDSLIYSIGITKFRYNNKPTALPCEGCYTIERNTIVASGNRAQFLIKVDSILEFNSWID